MRRQARLTYNPGTDDEESFTFVPRAAIGRRRGRETDEEHRIQIRDSAVSGRHCVVQQDTDGRFFIRDESRNGTRVDGRRLIPNVEVEVHPGAVIDVAPGHALVLDVDDGTEGGFFSDEDEEEGESTLAMASPLTEVTILVGDINGYTTLNERFGPKVVLKSVENVFGKLESVVVSQGGTLKEYQGDAIFAFWEHHDNQPNLHILGACRAALAANKLVLSLAEDTDVWAIPEFPLKIEWALTTGHVVISTMGGDRPTGLAMVGDAVNYAFRLEKLATEQTGSILACQTTEARAKSHFAFQSLGEHQVKGRAKAEPIFSLLGPV